MRYTDRMMTDGGGEADLQKTAQESADVASKTSAGSYKKTIRLPLKTITNQYKFWFTYLYQDPDTQLIIESERSPVVTHSFDIPNLTKGVLGLTLTPGYKSYGVKFTVDPLSVHEDIIIFESLTSTSIGDVVYIGTSNSVTIQTDSIATRWITVRTRDKWKDANFTDTGPLSVTPLNPDPDTTYTVANPASIDAVASIDPKDLSGFSVVSNITWAKSVNPKAAGYSIRWSTSNPAEAGVTPLWEYASVSGIDTLSYNATGLIPNTTYYYQVASTTPYDTIDWSVVVTKTFIAADGDGTAAGALARLKSFIAIGGASQDLFKIGTGISQSINLNTDPLVSPTLTAGTYHGIILNKSTTNVGNNFWLTTGQFRVGNPTEFMYWNGTNLYLTGSINATGGKFTGNVKLDGGTLFAGAVADSGQRVRLNSSGIFAYNATSPDATFSLDTAGYMNAKSGLVGGWSIGADKLEANSVILNSAGQISLGSTPSTSVFLSSTDAARIWVGSQSSSTSKFKVMADGTLYASGAVFGDYASKTYADGIGNTAASDATTKAAAAQAAAAADATTKANAAIAAAQTDAQTRATAAKDAAILASVAKADFNKDAIIAKLAPTTNTTSIDGGLISTGTLKAEAVVSNFISAFEIEASKIAVGTLSGHRLTAGALNTSYYLDTKGNKAGVDSLVINAIGIESSATGGVTTHWYPYMPGSPNIDLGLPNFRWNDVRSSGKVYMGHGGSDTITNVTGQQPYSVFLNTGRIYANTLGTGSGTGLVQDSNGYIRVSSSSRRYKENISEIENIGYLDAVNLLKPVKFSYKLQEADIDETPGYETSRPIITGLIAEDVEQIDKLKDFVNYNTLGETEGLAYDRLTTVLTLAIQEISNKIDTLSMRLDALEG